MSIANENKIIDALSIRDTSGHDSVVDESKGYIPKSLVVQNNLNQQVSCLLEGDIDESFSNPMIVNTFVVAANTDDYDVLTDYLPFFRVTATCSVAPTTGALTVYIAKVGD